MKRKPQTASGSTGSLMLRDSAVPEGADCAVQVTGNGMWPMYKDGDYVLIQYTDRLEPGEVGLFTFKGSTIIRQYYPNRLRAFREDLTSTHIRHASQYEIVARVLGVITKDMLLDGADIDGKRQAS